MLHRLSMSHIHIAVRSLYLVLMEMLEFCDILLKFIKDDVAIANRLRTSSEHFPSAVILLPKYLNDTAVSRSVPFIGWFELVSFSLFQLSVFCSFLHLFLSHISFMLCLIVKLVLEDLLHCCSQLEMCTTADVLLKRQ